MNKDTFNQLVGNPALLNGLNASELEVIVREHPWFSLAQVFLAKAYKEKGDFRTSQQLAVAATQHSNRNWMHQFIQEEYREKQLPETHEKNNTNEARESSTLEKIQPNNFDSKSLAEKILRDEFPETYTPSITEANSSPIKNEIISSPAIIEDSKEASVEPQKSFDHQSEKTSTHEEFDILDKHILAAAVSSSIYQEVSENHDVSKDQSVTASNPFKENYESDDNFINWLAGAALEHENEGVELEDVDIKKSEEIIEKFIASEPKITPGKVDQYNQIQLGKDSLEDNFEWVTETMAKLYISQGKTERARRVYKQLIILHPEKSIYYEQQLKSLNSRK